MNAKLTAGIALDLPEAPQHGKMKNRWRVNAILKRDNGKEYGTTSGVEPAHSESVCFDVAQRAGSNVGVVNVGSPSCSTGAMTTTSFIAVWESRQAFCAERQEDLFQAGRHPGHEPDWWVAGALASTRSAGGGFVFQRAEGNFTPASFPFSIVSALQQGRRLL